MKLNRIFCSIMCALMMVTGISAVNASEYESAYAQPRAAVTLYEQESNNTISSANQTYDDYDNCGAISSTTDVDYWKVSFSQNGQANFWLGNMPSNCNYDLYLYNQSGALMASSTNAAQNAELLQQSVVAGMTYYVKIVSSSGYSSTNYLFRAKNYPTVSYTWPTESRRITQYYSTSHLAVDVGPITPGVAGDDVYAFSQGTLYRYDYNQSAGYTARVNHPIDDVFYGAKYAHLTNPANVAGISTSGAVSNGAKIGEMNTTGEDSTGVHLHFELRQKSTEYNIYSDWYAGTPVDPAVFFPDILSATRSVNDSGFYFDADPTATEKTFTEAIYISHNGQDFDVRWIAGMSESEREMYDITDDVIEKAIDAVIGNRAYAETEQKLKAIN